MADLNWYEREKEDIIDRYNRGDIDRTQMNKELWDLGYTKYLDDSRRLNDGYGMS